MLLRELTGDLPLTSKAKSLLGKNTKDFFICLNTIIGGSNYLKDYVEDVNSILTKLYNEGFVDISFDEKYLNGVFKIKDIDMDDDDLILPTTKSHLIRDRKQIDYSVDLKIKSHEQPLFKENLESPTSFDTLVALKYLHKKVQADNRGIEFTLSLSDMARLMKAKRCYYTGAELTLDGSHGLSFDRKDSTLGYSRSNTVSCSAIANTLKENLMESCDVQQHLSKKEIKKMLLKFAELLQEMKMYSQLSYDIGWDWYNAWTMVHFRADPIVARKGSDIVYLENHSNCIFLSSTNKGCIIKFKHPCRTISELDDCKHELLNRGWKIDWTSYQLILEMYNEHFKIYAPYIK